ncbi:hypothetical protein K8O68_00340 [Salipaludibacillus sp. CUR1]|uniref:hypothetical protein n=1 Tax=Salipaludibacillus sp. CUR1 TaxID=2820003 RepID=UPI001E6214DF|nr:hypothetical protein [Salipaludibacillus sp. CUR1]MCE7790866.1 hypothetical protein [Salipaludibacillus sp. CUR1]
MAYILFILLFTLAHAIAYIAAGAIALKFSKDIYEEKSRHCDFMRDMSNKEESGHVEKYFLPAQILRGLLMAIVLLPLLHAILELPFAVSFLFFAGLMFIYTHLAAASPFMDNIEGLVYFKKRYVKKKFFFKFQMEMVMYIILFGLLITAFLTFIS